MCQAKFYESWEKENPPAVEQPSLLTGTWETLLRAEERALETSKTKNYKLWYYIAFNRECKGRQCESREATAQTWTSTKNLRRRTSCNRPMCSLTLPSGTILDLSSSTSTALVCGAFLTYWKQEKEDSRYSQRGKNTVSGACSSTDLKVKEFVIFNGQDLVKNARWLIWQGTHYNSAVARIEKLLSYDCYRFTRTITLE